MKTPSFGNNSGTDEQYTFFKSSERREKRLDLPLSTLQKFPKNTVVKEIDYLSFKNRSKLPESKSTVLEDKTLHSDHMSKYANKMGHKQGIQRFSRNSSGNNSNLPSSQARSGKNSTVQLFKPRTGTRNQHAFSSENSRTFIETHNFDQIETGTLPKINFDMDFSSRHEGSVAKSNAR